jgi:hypothetical protein
VASLVIGIYPQTDAKGIEAALSAQQVDVGKIKVLACDGPDEQEYSSLSFIDVAIKLDEESADDMTRGTGVLADSGGTSVPGLNDPPAHFDVFEHHGGTTKHYLSAFPVPDDEVDNFDDAIADGRAVVLYPDAGADAPKVVAAFKAAGLHNVRSY